MSAATANRPAFTDKQLQELQALVESADSVELKLTVPDADQRSTIRALEVDPLRAEIRQVFFLDTPDLALDGRGRRAGPSGAEEGRRHGREAASRRSVGAPRSHSADHPTSASRWTHRREGSSAPAR